MNQNEKKLAAATAALEYVPAGCILGVGTGSTVDYLIDALPVIRNRIEATVSSSEHSTKKLQAHGFDVLDLNTAGTLELYVDGADEATRHGHLIKGGGGALTREKIVAAASRKFVCIIDDSKLVSVLGKFPLPVEVVPMGRSFVARELVRLGGQPVWREDFVTDNGNHILDVHHLDLVDPLDTEREINQIPGVVCVGLFARQRADVLLVADADGVRVVE